MRAVDKESKPIHIISGKAVEEVFQACRTARFVDA